MTLDRINSYVALFDSIDLPSALEACEAILSRDESHRARRFAQLRHRHQYILAHGLLRLALSDAVNHIKPQDWAFARGAHGRPFVHAPASARETYFSLSHTEGCVACVVSQYELVGVDVEHVKAGNSLWDVAQTAFSPREIESLRHLPDEALSRRFFDYWTLKEAYLKARGCGLNLPPDQFSIMIASERIMIEFGPGVGDDPLRWHFAIGSPSAAHRLAIADGTGTPGGLPIVDRIGTLPGNRLNLPCGGLPSGSRAAG